MTRKSSAFVRLASALAAIVFAVSVSPARAEETETDDAEKREQEKDETEGTDKPEEAEKSEEAEPEKSEKPAPAPTQEPFARLWVGASLGFEIAFMPSGNDLCRLNPDGTIMNSVHAFCTDPAGRDFPVRGNGYQNGLMPVGGAGSLDGGPALGNYRLLLAVDYAVTPFLLIGARGGYVGNSYPGTAGMGGRPSFTRHVHGEVRGTYLFGDSPLSRVGFAPTAFVALGYGQYDGSAHSTIRYQGIAASEDVTIWVVSGPWFASVGGGFRYQFSSRTAFTAAARGNVSFGPLGSLLTAGPELAFLYGF